ncbi:MAG TPA: hypothetical protein VEI80_00115 [Candidatus Acidoferrales bacterium]|nr:hypothetical protein [Candidatus Acidoferrales bacterium]
MAPSESDVRSEAVRILRLRLVHMNPVPAPSPKPEYRQYDKLHNREHAQDNDANHAVCVHAATCGRRKENHYGPLSFTTLLNARQGVSEYQTFRLGCLEAPDLPVVPTLKAPVLSPIACFSIDVVRIAPRADNLRLDFSVTMRLEEFLEGIVERVAHLLA